VAPAWNGFRELIEHDKTGFLAPTAFVNDTELLSAFSMLIDPAYSLSQRVLIDVPVAMEYLGRLARNPELRQRLGCEARSRALNRYTWEKIVPQYEALWEEQVKQGRASRSNLNNAASSYYDYGQVFGHKTAKTICLDAVVLPGDPDLSFFGRKTDLFSPPQTSGFSAQLDDAILKAVEREFPLTLKQVIDEVAALSYSRQQVLTQIARLLKYGLLRLSDWESKQGEEITSAVCCA
jgi:hypothetical protein